MPAKHYYVNSEQHCTNISYLHNLSTIFENFQNTLVPYHEVTGSILSSDSEYHVTEHLEQRGYVSLLI